MPRLKLDHGALPLCPRYSAAMIAIVMQVPLIPGLSREQWRVFNI